MSLTRPRRIENAWRSAAVHALLAVLGDLVLARELDRVEARAAADRRAPPRDREDLVVAGAAVDAVRSRPARADRVVAEAAADHAAARAAVEDVVAATAVNEVRAGAAEDRVVAVAAEEDVVRAADLDRVVAPEDVVAGEAEELVGPGEAQQRVVLGGAAPRRAGLRGDERLAEARVARRRV